MSDQNEKDINKAYAHSEETIHNHKDEPSLAQMG